MPEKKWRPEIRPQDIHVGKYFVLSDFLYSEVANQKGIPNLPPSATSKEMRGIKGLCENILDPVVEKFGPVSIAYSFTSQNVARAARVSHLHQYRNPQKPQLIGGAADIVCHKADHIEVYEWVKDNCPYDRLILYPGSRIICLAWTDKPRFHAKKWIFTSAPKPLYLDYDKQAVQDSEPSEVAQKPKTAERFRALDLSDYLEL